MSFFRRIFDRQPDAASAVRSQFNKLADEYVSPDFGTRTIWEPYAGLPCDPRPNDSVATTKAESVSM